MDSPKHQKCVDAGLTGQTYKVAGKPLFRCSDCKEIIHRDEFEPEEFLWKQEPEKYRTWLQTKTEKKSTLRK